MAPRRLEISRTAEKQLRELPAPAQRRIVKAVLALPGDPHPQGARKLSGHDDVFRIRVGVYRVIYSVADEVLVVIVLKIGHRKDVYR